MHKIRLEIKLAALATLIAYCGHSAKSGDWPLTAMRHMGSTSFDTETMRALIAIDAKHPGCWDEYWLAESCYLNAEGMRTRAGTLGSLADACHAVGISPGFQQGVTLGHDFTCAPAANAYPLPEDAFQVDVDGRRTGFYCPRSPAVLAMEEAYAETYVRIGRLESFWLDDDLRLGFWKQRAGACFCDRCVADFNRTAGTAFSRQQLIDRLMSDAPHDPLRATWATFKAESLALFAAAARRGAVRANPNVRLGYQAISSNIIVNGEDYRPLLLALSDGGRRRVGIRPGHGYYNESQLVPRQELPRKLLGVAREAERCHAYGDLDVFVVYEQENYPHRVMYKSPEACLKESAMGLAAGCDGASFYWYSSDYPEPLEHYEDFARLSAAWRPYLARVAELSKGTHLGGVALKADDRLVTSAHNSLKAALRNEHARHDGKATVLAQFAVPVTVAESGTKSFVDSARIAAEMSSDERRKLLDDLDELPGGPLPVRIDKLHPLLVCPRTDAQGRTTAVTLLNLSIGRTQNVVLRVRRPKGTRATLIRPCEADAALTARRGKNDEVEVQLPDIPGWGIVTVAMSCEQPVKIVFDTDMGTDFDDVGALAMLHALADAGECEILATVVSTRASRAPGIVRKINAHYGRPNLPVGENKRIGQTAFPGTGTVYRIFRDLVKADCLDEPDANAIYRRVLAAQPDGSVTLCTVGFLTNLRRLLETPPDDISPLDGRTLVSRKVKSWYAMGGKVPNGFEYNLGNDAESTAICLEQWPTPAYFAPYHLGSDIRTGLPVARLNDPDNPVCDIYRRALEMYGETDCGHPTFDQTAVLAAVRGHSFFRTVRGTLTINGKGVNHWRNDPRGHHYLLEPSLEANRIAVIIDELMSRTPRN